MWLESDVTVHFVPSVSSERLDAGYSFPARLTETEESGSSVSNSNVIGSSISVG